MLSEFEKIRGTYVGPGVTCPQFRLDTGETVSLSALSQPNLKPGDRLILGGRWMAMSTCMQGRDFRIEEIFEHQTV